MEQRERDVDERTLQEAPRVDKYVRADFSAIIHDVLKNIWVAVLVGISAAFLAYVWAYAAYHPQYVSQTTFVVSAKGSNTGAYANLSQTQRLAEVFQTVLDSDVLKKLVAEQLGQDSFGGTVRVSIVPETNLLTVSVTADSPTEAFQLLNTMLEQYPAVAQNVLGEVVLEVFEEPGYPSTPSVGFQGNEMMKKGFLAGAGAMIVLFALLSYFKDTVKNEKEVEAKLDTTLYASIYHERKYKDLKSMLRREKKKLWITEPSVSFGFGETIKKIRTKLLYHQKKKNAKILVVSSAAPQEGKTTVAANLAMSMAQYPRKVLLVEGNLRSPALREYLGLDASEVKSWGAAALKGNLAGAVHYCKELGIYALVNDEKVPRSMEVLSSQAVTDFLDRMKEEMDLIIIDAPHVKGRADTEMWMRRADMSLLVVRQNKTLSKGYGYGYGYGYGGYGYGRYGKYGRYGRYGKYGSYYSRRHKDETKKKE